jgi:hypothetical protein
MRLHNRLPKASAKVAQHPKKQSDNATTAQNLSCRQHEAFMRFVMPATFKSV